VNEEDIAELILQLTRIGDALTDLAMDSKLSMEMLADGAIDEVPMLVRAAAAYLSAGKLARLAGETP